MLLYPHSHVAEKQATPPGKISFKLDCYYLGQYETLRRLKFYDVNC